VNSRNWSGIADSDGSTSKFSTADGRWSQEGFVHTCAYSSLHSIWTGIGGIGTVRLIQIGTSQTSQSDMNALTAWWEAINSSYNTYQRNWTGLAVRPGDTIRAYTHHASGKVTLSVFNITTGHSVSTGAMSSIGGYSASSFYDGRAADYIDERPSGSRDHPADGLYYYYRQPSSYKRGTYWSSMYTNGTKAGYFWHYNIVMFNKAGSVLAHVGNGMTSDTSFVGWWNRCS
jgi:hypothetical protein